MSLRPRFTWWEGLGLATFVAAFVLLRLPIYTRPGVLLGWNSDAALFGLMARAMAAGDVPLFFWGQNYLAPLTSAFALAVAGPLGEIGPLALRVGTAIEIVAAVLFFHFGLRRCVGSGAATIATIWLAAGPAFLFKLTYAPWGAEEHFLLGAVLFWYVARTRFERLHHWLLLGLLAGAGWWIHAGVAFVVVPALLVIAWFDHRSRRSELAIGLAVFTCGAALGYVPAIIGRMLADQRLYVAAKASWSLQRVFEQIASTVRTDLWGLLGVEHWLAGAVFVIALASAARHFEWRRETVLAAGVVGMTFAFWFLSTEAYSGALRYLVVAVPVLYAFSARELLRLRAAGIVIATAIGLSLFVPRHGDARELAQGRREQHEQWPGAFDPRPALRAIEDGGYAVCYADFWIAYKLEWLSGGGVRMIPHRSVNRRMVESLRLTGLPGKKCFVDGAGAVRELTPREQAEFRLDTLRLACGIPPQRSSR